MGDCRSRGTFFHCVSDYCPAPGGIFLQFESLPPQYTSERRKKPLSIGLIALFDDVAALAKMAAASLDDVAAQTAKAGAKAAGVVIDDAAVTPRFVLGFEAKRELPIVGKIAMGSLRNKILVLLPASLLLSYFLPSLIMPLLMIGGAYLCYEGTEKALETIFPHQVHGHEAQLGTVALNPHTLEDEKVASAIKTDFILSAEIMAIALATASDQSIAIQALVLAVVGIGITIAVYGVVALIVKADDIGVALARRDSRSIAGRASRAFGRALVLGMPGFLTFVGAIGTAAMIWVGSGIVLHGFERYGVHSIARAMNSVAEAVAYAVPFAANPVKWLLTAILTGIAGLLIGAVSIPIFGFIFAPGWQLLKRILRKRKVAKTPADSGC